ncbi:MAG: hypothetical protein CO039_02050 [Candidatus Pacebacteria bacterium CG_4_9_14_0_2_um_filter_34_50]|nr:MAG: hypothetical protein CO039_02050 [Candidatus Pacebacteria bacterium CG_4_9_14_0_2_um_filter_34_50]
MTRVNPPPFAKYNKMQETKKNNEKEIKGPILLRSVELSVEEWKIKLTPRKTDDDSIPYDDNEEKINSFRRALIARGF